MDQIVKNMPDGKFELSINGITFSGTKQGDQFAVLKVEVKPENVKDIVLAHVKGMGVDVSRLTYHEFKDVCHDYETHQFDGIVYEDQQPK